MENKQLTRTKSNRKNISPILALKLWVRDGGRCTFKGCNEYLLTDSLTLKEANFSNIAHIVAAEKDGPRGDNPLPMEERNKIANLMLMCLKHHHLIDDKKHVPEYPVELLRQWKQDHEEKTLQLTAVQAGSKTSIVRLRAQINGEAVSVCVNHIKNAILPRYMTDELGVEIDLTALPVGDDAVYWKTGMKKIDEQIGKIYQPGVDKKTIEHISVFAIGPIPLLIYLGNKLSNAVETDLFHLHKDIEDWTWKTDGDTVKYKIESLSQGKDEANVALLLSLSGSVKLEDLPKPIRDEYFIYQISLKDTTPNRMFMRKKDDLHAFRQIYRKFLCEVRKKHMGVKEILLFPAIPTPVAVACGRDLIKKADPTLIIYDFNKNRGGFRKILKVN